MLNLLLKRHILYRRCHGLSEFYRLFSSITSFDFPDLDFSYLLDPANISEIKENIKRRKGVGDIDEVVKLHKEWSESKDSTEKSKLKEKLLHSAFKIPNKSHPQISSLSNDPLVVRTIGDDRKPPVKALQFHDIANNLNVCRTENISNYTGPRSYYFLDDLAILEQALVRYTLNYLMKLKFVLVSVPDILPRTVIEHCGMETRGKRNQVYSLDSKTFGDLCLSGTAEMGIAYYLSRRKMLSESDLPLKIAAVSRCFRAETSKIAEEKGIYRVHQFTKVEMFGVCLPCNSDSFLEEFVGYQENIFDSLKLKLRTLDMPPPELGAQASRKYDIEAWLPGRQIWGEVSSASNCTDYQSRRLGIKSDQSYPHTINGTACAVPRLIIALLETHQNENGIVELPQVLEPFLESRIIRPSRVPKLNEFNAKGRFT